MSFFTALGLSLNNLMTKKTRTILTAFAGSIGIIGIALILSLSNGIQTYINDVQEDTLSSYPVTIEAESADMSGMVTALMGVHSEEAGKTHTDGRVYASNVMYDLMQSLNKNGTQTNDLEAFKRYLDNVSRRPGQRDPPVSDLDPVRLRPVSAGLHKGCRREYRQGRRDGAATEHDEQHVRRRLQQLFFTVRQLLFGHGRLGGIASG